MRTVMLAVAFTTLIAGALPAGGTTMVRDSGNHSFQGDSLASRDVDARHGIIRPSAAHISRDHSDPGQCHAQDSGGHRPG